jgi:2,4-dienoyl-CoA reductase-like NADH-dependent reductase (Old Yellow Enzyme family)
MTDRPRYTRVASLKTAAALNEHLQRLGVELAFDAELEAGPDAPLARPYTLPDRAVGNRFAILPMEGWDGTSDGLPSELTTRRWQRFGLSGAKLIWGCEAVAVRHDGRANPNQLVLAEHTLAALEGLRGTLLDAHRERHGSADDMLIGLQLTHSGRFCRPNRKDRMEPLILYPHPLLNAKFGLPPNYPTLSDDAIDELIGDFVTAAVRAQELGFDFVDIKHCHGYLGHEFLSAVDRPGRYGGSFENRTRFLREVTAGIRRDTPGLLIGVRLSAFDFLPFQPGPDGRGVPAPHQGSYAYAFGGCSDNPLAWDLEQPAEFLRLLEQLDIRLVCLTAGSPYYNPHIQRPALFPPSDGYQPPEDPLAGVARQIAAVAQLKARFPALAIVGSGYSYLQEWLPRVAQHNVRTGKVDFVGLGRMVLAYPELPADVLAGRPIQHKSLCRTFSDCTTGPRNGLVSGCYPLDRFYKEHPQHEQLKAAKRPPAEAI